MATELNMVRVQPPVRSGRVQLRGSVWVIVDNWIHIEIYDGIARFSLQ